MKSCRDDRFTGGICWRNFGSLVLNYAEKSVLGTSSWGSRWKINGEEMEEVKVWFDRCM